MSKLVGVFAVLMTVTLARPGTGHAESEPPRGGARATVAGMTQEQVHAFAELADESPYRVATRLAAEPQLVPLAARAADARMSRRTTGKVMTIVGFSILGIGDIAGAAILFTTPGYPKMTGHEGRFALGTLVALGSLGIGLGLGIPGIMKMTSPSPEEERALDAYSPTRPDLAVIDSDTRHAFIAPVLGRRF